MINRVISDSVIITDAQLKSIQDDLIQSHAELIVKGLLDSKAREQLKNIVIKEHGHAIRRNEELADYIVQETVGTGIIEEIIKDDSITDIGFNGTKLIIESNDAKRIYTRDMKISDDYIVRIIQKFANAVGKDFTPKQPVLDAVFDNMRINAVHRSLSPYGTTMSLRISRPKLALNENNFKDFAPDFMYGFFKSAVEVRSNIVIAGETGTGKTELQKLLISFIPFEQKIIMIEDVLESHVKEMFPNKDIVSWITNSGTTITTLIKAALRNNPVWIIVSETRGEEAYEMIQATLSGHYIITTLHASKAHAIPRRLVNMSKIGYSVSEAALEEDIKKNFHFGVHIKKLRYKGVTIRYLSEVIEFDEIEDKTIFEQKFIDGTFKYKTGKLSQEFKDKILEYGKSLNFPEDHKGEKSLLK